MSLEAQPQPEADVPHPHLVGDYYNTPSEDERQYHASKIEALKLTIEEMEKWSKKATWEKLLSQRPSRFTVPELHRQLRDLEAEKRFHITPPTEH